MPIWWPLGTHDALKGTSFDLPVSQLDYFATFADILGYPLPNGDKCTYAYDTDTAKLHDQEPSRLGRPGLYPNMSVRDWLSHMKRWDFTDKSKNISPVSQDRVKRKIDHFYIFLYIKFFFIK